jgi:hypothetical protein
MSLTALYPCKASGGRLNANQREHRIISKLWPALEDGQADWQHSYNDWCYPTFTVCLPFNRASREV